MTIGNLEQMLDEYGDVTDFTENGKCTGCGNCCGNFLPVSEREVRIIRNYVKTHGIKEQKHLCCLLKEQYETYMI